MGMHLAVCTTAYDTGHESVALQVQRKIEGLRSIFPEGQWSFYVASESPEFTAAVEQGVADAGSAETHIVLFTRRHRGDTKGLGLRHALRAAMTGAGRMQADALAYINLNLKVDARYLADALAPIARGDADVVVGTRAPSEGGEATGQGTLGLAKSRAWSALARAMVPSLAGFADPNAPLKVMTRAACQVVLEGARVDGVGLDAEWLCLWQATGQRMIKVPIVWTQRPGSSPPWHLIPEMLLSLAYTRWRCRSLPGARSSARA